MALLDDSDDLEVFDAALSFVDAFILSEDNDSHSDDPPQDKTNQDQLSSSSSTGSRNATAPRFVLPTPLPPLSANFQAADVAKLKGNGRLRGGCRASLCRASSDADKLSTNRARDERKNELAYLRNKVTQMEMELGELQLRRRNCSAPPRTPQAASIVALNLNAEDPVPPIWRDMATRQKLGREKAERENARLKLVLQGQIKLAQSMETLLQKRTRQQLSECAHDIAEDAVPGRALDFLAADKNTFDVLLARADIAYQEVDQVLAANGLIDSETSTRDARMCEGANGIYLDIHSNKLLPFSKEAVGAAVWGHFKGTDKHRGVIYEKAAKALEPSDDTVMEDFKMEFMGKITRADFHVKQVLRRFVEADREVVVSVTNVYSLDEGGGRPFAGMGFAEKSYVVIKQPKSPDLLKEGYTVLQMCSIAVPYKSAGYTRDTTAVGAFTEFVLNVVLANATVSQERIEDALLDQALKRSRG